MAWVRRLPSGKWAATVYTPDGRKTETHELKGSVERWAADLERDIRHLDYINPKAGEVTVGTCWDELVATRRVEKSSRKRDESHWRCHVGPRWGKTQLKAVLKPNVQAWINTMEDNGVGPNTIVGCLKVLKSVLEHAVDTRRLRANPARGAKPPIVPRHIDRVIEADEEDILLERLDELFPNRPDARLFIEVMFETGGRWEEVAAIPPENVSARRKRVRLLPVMERDGTVRPYPKNARPGEEPIPRDVPISDELTKKLRVLAERVPKGTPIFRTAGGGYVTYTNWLHRIWHPTVRVPVFDEGGRRVKGSDGKPLWEPLLEEPLPTPHDIRHSYGSRLADGGLEVHDVMALMGHQDMRSAQRYIHSGEKRFDRAREALRRAREGR